MDKQQELYQKYLKISSDLHNFTQNKIPLCAAETYVSDFVKSPLSSEFEGKYCMGNRSYDPSSDFIGSIYIHQLFELLSETCKEIFNAKFSDARTLSGMNCMGITISSLLKPKSKVLLTTPEQGGHASVVLLLKLYDIEIQSIPYDFIKRDIDYDKLNELLQNNHYDAIIFAQSDLINPADVSKIKTDTLIIYDATQTFGMIASHIHKNPLDYKKNIVLIGGTHKTLPGPTSGLILSNNDALIDILDVKISPSYLRNVQPNNIASLLLALFEQMKFGKEYQQEIIDNANYLGKKLEELGLTIAKIDKEKYTKTHQIFLLTDINTMNIVYNNAIKYGITLNKKTKPLFDGYGIRIGLQEITRYKWTHAQLDLLAKIILEITKNEPNGSFLVESIKLLSAEKINQYSYL